MSRPVRAMQAPLPGDGAFLRTVWRRRPALYRRFFSPSDLRAFPRRRFVEWCCDTRESVRLFIASETYGPGGARSVVLDSPADAAAIFDLYKSRGERFTILLNRVERVDPTIDVLRRKLCVPYEWRKDDVIATLSTVGSGIGYHAGHEDGFIVQLRGGRRWRVWNAHLTPDAYRLRLLRPVDGPDQRIYRSNDAPLIDCELEPGDVLYIPPFFPHEGLTTRESLALSVAWRGVCPYHLLEAVADRHPAVLRNTMRDQRLFCLLPDRESAVRTRTLWIERTFAAVHAKNRTAAVWQMLSAAAEVIVATT